MYSRTTVEMVGVGEMSIKCSAISLLSTKFTIPGPEVLKLFLAQLSMKFQLLKKINIA